MSFAGQDVKDHTHVMIKRRRLNHKVFKVTVNADSNVNNVTVLVRFFLAPKYNSEGHEIPLHENYMNFFQFDQFTYNCEKIFYLLNNLMALLFLL